MIHVEGNVPDFIESVGGTLETTAEQYKLGTQSVKWTYRDGASVHIHAPVGYVKIAEETPLRYACSVYLYGMGGAGWLKVMFCKEGRVCCSFDIQLGFWGWRSVSAGFDRDMQGQPEFGMDEIVVEAHGGEGVLLASELVPSQRMDYRTIMASEQTPSAGAPLAPLTEDWTLKPHRRIDVPCDGDSSRVMQSMAHYVAEEFPVGMAQRARLLERVEALNIEQGPLGLRGKRIEYSGQRVLVGARTGSRDYVELQDVCLLLRDLAVGHQAQPSPELAEAYLRVLQFLMEQGFAKGSTMGTHAGIGEALHPLYQSVFLMHSEIRKSGCAGELLDAMRWFLHMGSRGFLAGQPCSRATVQDLCECAQGMLAAVLMLKDPIMRAEWLLAYRSWLSGAFERTKGAEDLLKEDGCLFYQGRHSTGAGLRVMTYVAPVAYALSGTVFDLPAEAWNNMKFVLLNLRFQCNTQDIPLCLTDQPPLGSAKLDPMPFQYFALSALARREEQMVRVYLRLLKKPQNQMDYILSAFARAESAPLGNRSYPYACANVHRFGDWEVVVKGFHAKQPAAGAFQQQLPFEPDSAYCVIEALHKEGLSRSGYAANGYDWNHFPGATNVVPPDKNRQEAAQNAQQNVVLGVVPEQGTATRPSSQEDSSPDAVAAAGCVSMEDGGLFAMTLAGGGQGVAMQGQKSVFIVGSFLLCMGSGITNDSLLETETTLYQNAILTGDMPPQIGGRMITGDVVTEDDEVLEDNRGHRYYLPRGTRVRLRSGLQHAISFGGQEDSEGPFAIGSIVHGSQPQQAAYVYGMGIGGAEALPYEVIQQDRQAHAARIAGLLCVALFTPGEAAGVQVDAPLLLMLRHTEDGVRLALCRPQPPVQGGVQRVTLRIGGNYRLAQDTQEQMETAAVEVDGGQTAISLSMESGMGYLLDLVHQEA